MGWGALFMVLTLILSTVLGFLTGLGVGGGSLLVLWLTAVVGWEPLAARSTNLLFFLPGAVLSLVLRRRELRVKQLLPAIVSGCLAAVAGSLLSQVLDTALLRRLFGVLLVVTGLRELTYRFR